MVASSCASHARRARGGRRLPIVEIHGIEGEPVGANDPLLPLAESYRRSVDRQRIMFLIGEKNRVRGFVPVGYAAILRSLLRRGQINRRSPPPPDRVLDMP
jgi:hypothetical protein